MGRKIGQRHNYTVHKKILIIAGPNGAGKTTNALSLQPNLLKLYEFINADEIARGLAPLHPESVALSASKLMVKRLRELLASNKNFAFETTAAGTNYLKYLEEAKAKDYEINLMFLWLSSPELAIKRVAKRVEAGGHHVPEETIRRRYKRGLENLLRYYLPISHNAIVFDNSEVKQKIILKKNLIEGTQIEDSETWERINV